MMEVVPSGKSRKLSAYILKKVLEGGGGRGRERGRGRGRGRERRKKEARRENYN